MYYLWYRIYIYLLRIFSGLPSNFWDQDYAPPSQAPCIIDHLCKKHDGISVEAKGIKEYSWKIHIKKLFETGVSIYIEA
jgi:retinoblastoma-like protein 1